MTIIAMDAGEQSRRVRAAVALRAFEIFERRGPGSNEQENWRRAESALLGPLCLGRMTLDDTLWLSTEATPFEAKTVNIWVAPRRVTICGKPLAKGEATTPAPNSPNLHEEMIFRVVSLPGDVDPSRVTARFKGQFLEILLGKAKATPKRLGKAAVA